MKNTRNSSKVIRKNLSVLKQAIRITPELVIIPYVQSVIDSLVGFASGPLVLQRIVNSFQNQDSVVSTLVFACVCYIASFLWNMIRDAYYNFRTPVLKIKISSFLKEMIYKKNVSVELGCFEDKEFFEKYVKAASSLEGTMYAVINSTSRIISRIVSLFMFSFVVVTIDPVFILFAIIPVISEFTIGKKRNKIQHDYDVKLREFNRQRSYSKRVFYLPNYAKDLRLTNIYRVLIRRFDYYTANIKSTIKKYGLKSLIVQLVNDFVFQEICGHYIPLVYALFRTIISKQMLYGDCIIVINSVAALSYILSGTASDIMSFHSNSLYIDDIQEYLNYKPKIISGKKPAPSEGIIKFNEVSFKYKNQNNNAVQNINFEIRPGEKVALFGNNGAGKSTLIKLLTRLYEPTEGRIVFAGLDVSEYKLTGENGYRELFNVMTQNYKLFSISIKDNILMGLDDIGDTKLNKALKESGLYEKIMSLKSKADTNLTKEFDKNGVVLSGGEEQKIALSRFFAHKSSIMVLDEPTASLDPIAEDRIYKNIIKEFEGKTIIYVSHRMSSALLADKIIYMEDGRITEIGTHEDLMKHNNRYAEAYRIQSENYL